MTQPLTERYYNEAVRAVANTLDAYDPDEALDYLTIQDLADEVIDLLTDKTREIEALVQESV